MEEVTEGEEQCWYTKYSLHTVAQSHMGPDHVILVLAWENGIRHGFGRLGFQHAVIRCHAFATLIIGYVCVFFG